MTEPALGSEPFMQDPWPRPLSERAMWLGWPDFAQRWLGGEYPAGRGQPAEPQSGWQCPGCSRCFSPATRQCGFCGPGPAAPLADRDLTWAPDAAEPDES